MRFFYWCVFSVLMPATLRAQSATMNERVQPLEFTDLLVFGLLPLLGAALFVLATRSWLARRLTDQSGHAQRVRLYGGPLAMSLVLMLMGLVATITMAERMRRSILEEASSRFAQQSEAIERDFSERTGNLVHALYGVRGAILASDDVTREEFARLIGSRDIGSEYPGVRGLGYTERVARSQLASFVQQMRRQGAVNFTVQSQGKAEELYVAKYLEPPQPNSQAIGMDIAAEPVRRAAADLAMRSGQPTLSRRISLAQDAQGQPATLMLLPVYRSTQPPVTLVQREMLLRGWVVAPIVYAELLSNSPVRNNPWVAYQLFDARQQAAQTLLFDNEFAYEDAVAAERLQRARNSLYSQMREVSLLGHTYYLQTHSKPEFDSNLDFSAPRQTAFLGAGLSVLGAMVLWLLMVGRLRTVELAKRMTQDLNRLALVAQRTSNGVLFSDTQRCVTWVNEGFSRISGYGIEDMRGRMAIQVLLSPRTDPSVVDYLATELAAGRVARGQMVNRRKDGQDFWVDVEIQPVLDENGERTGFMTVQTDITAEVHARDALQREKERADNILSGTNVGTWESNLITGEAHTNERWSTMMGFTPGEVLPNPDAFWQERLHPDDRARINNGISRCVQGVEESYSIDVRVQRKDGSWMWILSRAKVMSRTPDGRAEWIGGIHTDITESKMVELSLRDTEAFLARAGHISGVGGWQYDLRSKALVLSEQTRLIHGFESDRQVSMDDVLAFYPQDERERMLAAISDAIENGKAWDMVLRFKSQSGLELWVRQFGEVEYDDSGAVRLVGAFQDVTRDHQAQLEIKRSSDLLRGAIDAINEAFVVYDPQDRLVFCNEKYRALYDKSADLIVPGATFESIIRGGAQRGQYVAALGRMEEWIAERMEIHRQANNSMEQRLDDGRWLKVVERRMPDGHTVGFRVDITELKTAVAVAESATAKLAEEQRRLQSILDGTNIGTWEWNIQSGAMVLSDQWASMLGYSSGELGPLGMDTWMRLAHAQDLVESSRRLHAHVQGQTPMYDAEVRMQHKDGHWVWILVRGKLSRWTDDGRPLWVSGTHMDISERKLAEQALAETSATLQSVFDSAANVGMITTGLDRIIQVFNRGAENLLGYRAKDLVGKVDGSMFFASNELMALRESLALTLGREPSGQETFEHVVSSPDATEWTLVRKDGSRFKASLLFSSLHDAEGGLMGYLGVIHDISKQKEYEASLREAMQLAEQSSVAKSQFLANMSHEIRTPMNAILGMLQLMRNTPLSPRQRDYADKTEGAARSLLGLLNDILDFSKVEAGKMQINPEPFRLDDLLGDLSVILSSNLGAKNVDLVFDVDPAIPAMLVADALRLKQILINLGGNAVKFTERGEVVVRWTLLAQTPERARIRIAIADSGIGIAPENQSRIFEGFTQAEANTTRRFGGTGLGLVISARLVGLMGSKLELQSAVGQGTTFSFVLDVPVVEQAPQELSAPDNTQQLRTLLVDDNPTARTNSAAIMRALGWDVVLAESGAQAVAWIEAHTLQGGEALHAVFVDDQMPDMDGWQTLRQIRRLYRDAALPKFILVSSQSRQALTRRTGREQELLDAVMVKPLTASMFTQALEDAQSQNFSRTQASSPAPEGPGRLAGMRLLLVEDNPINQQVAFELLHGEGAQVSLADNGQLGVDAVRAAEPGFHAVLMDLQMPVMDGLAAARLLRQDRRWDSLPIIAMTANAMVSDREACLDAGMNDHIGKPFDLNDLVDVLCKHTRWAVAPVQAEGVQTPPKAGCDSRGLPWPAAMDVQTALARMGGKQALLRRSILAFVEDAGTLPQRVDALVQAHALSDAGRQLHALKGLCATLGLAQLAQLAAQAERQALDPARSATAPLPLQDLWAQLHCALPMLQDVAQRLAPPTEPVADAPAGMAAPRKPDASQMEQLNGLLAALQSSDMAAMELHARLRQSLPRACEQAVEPLDAAIADLDFDTAAVHCKNLITQWT